MNLAIGREEDGAHSLDINLTRFESITFTLIEKIESLWHVISCLQHGHILCTSRSEKRQQFRRAGTTQCYV